MPLYLFKTKKSDEPSVKVTFTSGFPFFDLSSIREKDGRDPEFVNTYVSKFKRISIIVSTHLESEMYIFYTYQQYSGSSPDFH